MFAQFLSFLSSLSIYYIIYLFIYLRYISCYPVTLYDYQFFIKGFVVLPSCYLCYQLIFVSEDRSFPPEQFFVKQIH